MARASAAEEQVRDLATIIADNKLYGFVRSTDGKVLCVGCARRGGEAGTPQTGRPMPCWSPLTGLIKRNFKVAVETLRCERCQRKLTPEEDK